MRNLDGTGERRACARLFNAVTDEALLPGPNFAMPQGE